MAPFLASETIVRHRIAPGIDWNASRTLNLPYFARNGQQMSKLEILPVSLYSCLLALKGCCLGSTVRVIFLSCFPYWVQSLCPVVHTHFVQVDRSLTDRLPKPNLHRNACVLTLIG